MLRVVERITSLARQESGAGCEPRRNANARQGLTGEPRINTCGVEGGRLMFVEFSARGEGVDPKINKHQPDPIPSALRGAQQTSVTTPQRPAIYLRSNRFRRCRSLRPMQRWRVLACWPSPRGAVGVRMLRVVERITSLARQRAERSVNREGTRMHAKDWRASHGSIPAGGKGAC